MTNPTETPPQTPPETPTQSPTQTPTGKRAEAQALRRKEILEAAARVFAEKGYHGSSMRDIADILSVRQAALYYYFPSKEAILEEICRLGITEFVDALRAVAATPGPFAERLRQGIAAHLTPLLARRFYVSAFLYSRHVLPAATRAPLDRLAEEYEQIWRDMLVDARAAGEIAPGVDTDLAAFALLGALNAVARRPGIVGRADVRAAAERFATLFEAGLLPH